MSRDGPTHAVATRVEATMPPGAQPAPDRPLAQAMAMGVIPPDMATLYQRSDGLCLPEVDIFDLDDALSFSEADEIRREYPGGLVIGWDRSSYLFLLDAGDTLHRGAGAILAIDKVYTGPQSAIFVAQDLARFLDAMAAGQRPWESDSILSEDAAALAAELAETQVADARPPLAEAEMFAAADSAGVPLTDGLAAFYGLCDGVRFAHSGLTLSPVADLVPVEAARTQTGAPGAAWFGSAPDGTRLAVTLADFRRPSDLVVQLAEDGGIDAAPAFGRLFPTLLTWLRATAPTRP